MGERKVSVTMKKGIGAPVRRKEDARLLIGAGCYSDDVNLPRQAHAFVLRSVTRTHKYEASRRSRRRRCAACLRS